MNWIILAISLVLTVTTGAQAKNQIYGSSERGIKIEGDGYNLFVSDAILDTVDRKRDSNDNVAGFCKKESENTSDHLGEVNAIRRDNRLSIAANAKISYFNSCKTYSAVVDRLTTADDVRKLWLLFGDSTTDGFAIEALQKKETNQEINAEIDLMIESKRLAIISKYIEFFLKNKEWKLSDYTFLSQAFKARKNQPLSPAYVQFIEALLTGNTETAFKVVTTIDIDNFGARLIPDTHAPVMEVNKGQ